ncbi:SPOR domain-containing protein [Moorena producens JHB]|uniref:SPOR domain-containing protein n=1 Tax=Moorena producens (strain JHB) TaxID=1454205 RepID=A0A1D9G2I8_MOOP1|nr:SPOR domain-containing protein [Moorena producens]AOY81839.1 SPOR domain-containing protein [Moorena producens JHB]
MTYSHRLHPWAIVRLLPKMQRVVVGRFRNRSDAEGHLKALKRLMPDAQFVIVFDVGILLNRDKSVQFRITPSRSIDCGLREEWSNSNWS